VVLFTALAWMWGGMTLTLLNVFTGMLVDPARRGRIFSLMFLVYPLDALAGGTAVALLTRAYGYTAMFYVLAAVAAVQPLVGLIGLRGAQIVRPSAAEGPKRLAAPLGRPFALLLASSLLSIGCISIGRLGTSLAMQALGSSPEAIASTTIVSGLVTIPIVLAIGWVSDRVGRRGVLALSYLLAAAGTLLLAGAAQVWQFQIAATMLLAAWCVNRAVASALATDILPRDAIARGLSWLGSTDSIASIVGFAISGFVLDAFGAPVLFGAASALGLAAIAALTGLSKASRLGSPPDARVYATDRAAVASPGVSGKPS
jgi:MFS family permease